MKRIAIAAAVLLSSASFGVAVADSDRSADNSFGATARQRSMPSWGERDSDRAHFAQGFFHGFGGGEGERHRHRHHWDDDDEGDDDDDGGSASNGRAANRAADPNAATTPVPNSGVFNGKARPKVEVQ